MNVYLLTRIESTEITKRYRTSASQYFFYTSLLNFTTNRVPRKTAIILGDSETWIPQSNSNRASAQRRHTEGSFMPDIFFFSIPDFRTRLLLFENVTEPVLILCHTKHGWYLDKLYCMNCQSVQSSSSHIRLFFSQTSLIFCLVHSLGVRGLWGPVCTLFFQSFCKDLV